MPPLVRSWVEARTGSTVRRVRRLTGASSTAVHGVYLSDGARVVLRRYVWPGFLVDEPIAPTRELDAMRFAFAHGLAVPEVIAADPSGEEVGDGVPALLMTFLGGRPTIDPDPGKLAEVAAAIHDVDAAGFDHVYFPWYGSTSSTPPVASARPELWERAIELWRDAMPAYRPAFIHRDFHPGNVLWRRGRHSGTVDWANACRGPRGCDLAHCRANLRDLGGEGIAARFVTAYESLTDTPYEPYWEMASILEHGASHWTAANLAAMEPLLARAVNSVLGS